MKSSFFRGIKSVSIDKADIIITGLAFEGNCSNVSGTKNAPQRIRELSTVVTPFAMDGTSIESVNLCDLGDIEDYNLMESKAKEVFAHKGFPFFIGGDHSVSIWTEKVFIEKTISNNKTPVIIHMDAHADIMSIYQNNVYSHATPNYHALQNGLKPQNMLMIGIRSYEDIEVEYLKNNPSIHVYGIEKIWQVGIPAMLDHIKSLYGKDGYDVYLSLDIDCADPAYAPGTGTPEAFGLTSKEVFTIVKQLFADVNIKAMDIVEISPSADCNDITSYLGIKLLYEVMKFIKNREN